MEIGIEKVTQFFKQGYKIYIYGIGLWGRNVYKELERNKIKVDGFVVTKKDNLETLFDLDVLEYSSLEHELAVLVLGLNQHNTNEVYDYLVKKGFDVDRIIYTNDIFGFNDIRCGYDEVPCLDITTRIGCHVNCKYCPQAVLLKNYFKQNPNRERLLRIDTFVKCMENMPDNANYQFGGMAEPFLNPDCLELIRVVCEAKHTVNLYTTLVGLNEETLYKVMELPIDYVTLHVADAAGYAKIPLTEEYYHLLKIALNSKKPNGKMFIDMCNAQEEPDNRVRELCEGKYIISSTLLDRAGNLEGENLVNKKIDTGRISCGICGKALNKNELLPDGTLLLCCMDYSLEHELGNLKNQPYEEIMNGTEMKRIKNGMEFDFGQKILCRSCSSANLES